SAVLSIIIPLVQTTIYHYREEAASKAIRMLQVVESANHYLDEVVVGKESGEASQQWFLLLYLLVSALTLVVFIRSLLHIAHLVASHKVHLMEKVRFVNTRSAGTPFSFFRYIFWNEDIDLQSHTGQQIFQHELVHVQERHSLDKIFMQLLLILFWCNPF